MDPIDQIRKIYEKASRATIARDFDRAVDLLKSLPTEEERGRAAVFMEGLAELRKQWLPAEPDTLPRKKKRP
jgi:hypothetical protein